MRLIYLDSGLIHNVGHHANSCRLITREARSRKIPCAVLGNARMWPDLQREFGAQPLFRISTYDEAERFKDPISGWLLDYERNWLETLKDLRCVTEGLEADDLVYFNTAQPIQLRALVEWFHELPPFRQPKVVIEFGLEPGLVVVPGNAPGERTLTVRHPFEDPHGVLYRHSACFLTERDQARFHLGTFDPLISNAYHDLLRYPCRTYPLPHYAITNCRSRVGVRPITIGILGHQRHDKGFQHVPEIAKRLLQERQDIRLLVHNAAPDGMTVPQAALRRLAAQDARLILDEAPADLTRWGQLLDQSDLIVCPYDPMRYAVAYSALAGEAVSNAVPFVAPAGTTLIELANQFGQVSTEFSAWEPGSIVLAVLEALNRFDELAEHTHAAAMRWPTIHGPKAFFDAILSL